MRAINGHQLHSYSVSVNVTLQSMQLQEPLLNSNTSDTSLESFENHSIVNSDQVSFKGKSQSAYI